MRIGHGFDVHRFGPGNGIILAGVTIPYRKGIIAHSDGDVVIHALCDALLGAAGLGDIGQHFPDTDPKYQDCNSRYFLQTIKNLLSKEQFAIANADITIVAQAPKVLPYRQQMCNNLAHCLELSVAQVNIKATTTEKMGYIGKEEGIAVHAVVLLIENNH